MCVDRHAVSTGRSSLQATRHDHAYTGDVIVRVTSQPRDLWSDLWRLVGDQLNLSPFRSDCDLSVC